MERHEGGGASTSHHQRGQGERGPARLETEVKTADRRKCSEVKIDLEEEIFLLNIIGYNIKIFQC